jgi:apolipoprotein N-acyltransferase
MISVYRERSSWQAFFFGFLTGSVFFIGVCHWITDVLKRYGDLGWTGAFASFLLLVAYLSLFYAAFSLSFSRLSIFSSVRCFYLSPFFWVTAEYLRGHLLTGFPWCLLGYALVDYVNLAQLSTVTGIYGISFAAVLVNSMVASLLLTPTKAAAYRLGMVCLLLGGTTVFFSWKKEELSKPKQEVRIVQTNISPEQSWDREPKAALLNELSDLSTQGSKGRKPLAEPKTVRITVWPETPAPFYFNHDPELSQRMRNLAETSAGYLLFGFVDFKSSGIHPSQRDPYNSVALLSPSGVVISQYDKIHLVPFGEYVPYASFLFFIDKISTEAGNFKPGSRPIVPFIAGDHKLGTFVCYEAIFPNLVRCFAAKEANVFVNVTNDGWFGNSAAPFQHLNMARFRAIENHRYLLRAANSGISAIIDPYGRIQKKSSLDVRTVLDSTFEFENRLTLYTRYGDVFSWVCLGVTLLFAGFLVRHSLR